MLSVCYTQTLISRYEDLSGPPGRLLKAPTLHSQALYTVKTCWQWLDFVPFDPLLKIDFKTWCNHVHISKVILVINTDTLM